MSGHGNTAGETGDYPFARRDVCCSSCGLTTHRAGPLYAHEEVATLVKKKADATDMPEEKRERREKKRDKEETREGRPRDPVLHFERPAPCMHSACSGRRSALLLLQQWRFASSQLEVRATYIHVDIHRLVDGIVRRWARLAGWLAGWLAGLDGAVLVQLDRAGPCRTVLHCTMHRVVCVPVGHFFLLHFFLSSSRRGVEAGRDEKTSRKRASDSLASRRLLSSCCSIHYPAQRPHTYIYIYPSPESIHALGSLVRFWRSSPHVLQIK